MNSADKFGEIVNRDTGEVLVQMFGPPRAAGREDLSGALYALSELLVRGYDIDGFHGGLAGPFSFGVKFENDVFLMCPDYQDAKCECGFSKRAEEWSEANKDRGNCYSVVINRIERGWKKAHGIRDGWSRSALESRSSVPFSVSHEAFQKMAGRICAMRGIDWNDGVGCRAHCDCGRQKAADLWFAANDHEFRCPHRIPNFWHKRTGLEIRWYKSIGRDMEIGPEELFAEPKAGTTGQAEPAAEPKAGTTGQAEPAAEPKAGSPGSAEPDLVSLAVREAFESIPVDVRRKAQESYDAEHTVEAEEEREIDISEMFDAMRLMDDAMVPCWGCSGSGQIKPLLGNKSGRGGFFSGGVGKTLHDDSGSCLNCGHVNTPNQTARLAQREQENIESMRKMWADVS